MAFPSVAGLRCASGSPRCAALKIEQLGMLGTVVVAFAALAALVLTGQAGIRQDLRAQQIEMRAGLTELRAGQARIREDLAVLGVRLALVEHRTDALESRFAPVEAWLLERAMAAEAPPAGPDPADSPAGSSSQPAPPN